MTIAIIGAGAAGCFCAINLKRLIPQADVHVFEASRQALAKVAVSGGGRCNLTNTFANVRQLSQAYPRGEKIMRRALHVFGPNDTMEWFENAGIRLTTQTDQRIFPLSGNAMEVVGALKEMMRRHRIALHLSHKVTDITATHAGNYVLTFADAHPQEFPAQYLVIACGGLRQEHFLRRLQLDIMPPVPSLFTFNIAEPPLAKLAGTTIAHCAARIAGTPFRSEGSLLVTHWGMSGPCILKLSAYAARHLADNAYSASLCVNWTGRSNEEDMRLWIETNLQSQPHKHLDSLYPGALTQRFWRYLLQRCQLETASPYNSLNKKQINRLATTLTNDVYTIAGQSRNKEEFVTCGGVATSSISLNTLESLRHPRLYFAGEVLDIDGITGGFNLQSAWSTGYVVADSIRQAIISSSPR